MNEIMTEAEQLINLDNRKKFLLDECMKRYGEDGGAKIKAALEFAEVAHGGIAQKRSSGEPYIIHPIETAIILLELNVDVPTMQAALLHDVLEDTPCSTEELTAAFGAEVVHLVDGVTKLSNRELKANAAEKDIPEDEISVVADETKESENLRKFTLAIAKDVRVVLIKLADRLHNLHTLCYCSPAKQRRKAKESLDIYAPLAHRLGINVFKWQIEDESLKYLDSEGYRKIIRLVNEKRTERERYIEHFKKVLGEELAKAGIQNVEITGRPKHFYSIYNKMYKQNKSFEELYDILGIRVIISGDAAECYNVLGVVHSLWKIVPGRFKDYISNQKSNGYESLHTTVIGPGDKFVEVQIRTVDMHRTAEYGIAAHWRYKEGSSKTTDFDRNLSFLRPAIEEAQSAEHSAEGFLESLKTDVLFQEEVLVVTPNGQVKSLPRGATPLDFAYAVHTELGHMYTGAKVNGVMVPINYELKTGDEVEILKSSSHTPTRDWLTIVKTAGAKSSIRRWFKNERKSENVILGRDSLERELKERRMPQSLYLKNEYLEKLAVRKGFTTIDDYIAAIGYGSIKTSSAVDALNDLYEKEHKGEAVAVTPTDEEIIENYSGAGSGEVPPSHGIIINGQSGIEVRLAKCCCPIPGDPIIGYVTIGGGIAIHRTDCSNIQQLIGNSDRVLRAEWGTPCGDTYLAKVKVYAEDLYGIVADISKHINEINLDTRKMGFDAVAGGKAVISLAFMVRGLEHLNSVINMLNHVKGVREVVRV